MPFATVATPLGTPAGAAGPRPRRVPVFSSLRGQVTKRDWTFLDKESAAWCAVCSEPIAQWLTHIGRKDHSLLDSHYDALVDFPGRRWDPARVLVDAGMPVHDTVHPAALSSSSSSSSNVKGDRSRCTLPAAAALEAFHAALDKQEHHRRLELHAMIGQLAGDEWRALLLDRTAVTQRSHWFGASLEGHLAIHQFMVPALVRLLSTCDLPLLSNFEDFVSSSYNMETVYDVCGFASIDPLVVAPSSSSSDDRAAAAESERNMFDGLRVRRPHQGDGLVVDLAPGERHHDEDEATAGGGSGSRRFSLTASGSEAARGASYWVTMKADGSVDNNHRSPAASPVGTSGGAGASSSPTDTTPAGMNEGSEGGGGSGAAAVAFSRKANFVRDVLGQLRWCLTDAAPPAHIIEKYGPEPEDYGVVQELGRACALSLIAELLVARISEYVVRSEAVWRRYGMERRLLTGDPATDDPLLWMDGEGESRWDATPKLRIRQYMPMPLSNDGDGGRAALYRAAADAAAEGGAGGGERHS